LEQSLRHGLRRATSLYTREAVWLSRMTVTTQVETDGQTSTQTHTVDLTYDASGNPQTMTYDGVTYYYTVNIQGDVSGIVDENGNVLVRYTYQAYGISYYYGVPTNSVGPTLRQINPLTYRGYVYDKETKLNYLQSRYYNRTSGRFINADSLVITGQGLLGNNMFAYCGNNPVMGVDVSGMAPCAMTSINAGQKSPYDYLVRLIKSIGNTDEKLILESEGIFFYRGALVIHADLLGNNGSAFSYGGVIWIDDFYENNEDGINTLKHEYGHYLHMRQIGLPAYTATVALPSLAGAAISDPNGAPFQQFLYDNYYSQPWERIANELGDVPGDYLKGSDTLAVLYWIYTVFYPGALLKGG